MIKIEKILEIIEQEYKAHQDQQVHKEYKVLQVLLEQQVHKEFKAHKVQQVPIAPYRVHK
jgi:hypothetical protein